MVPGKLKKGQDVQASINKWEGWINMLERDRKEKISDMMKIGSLIAMMPDELQDTICFRGNPYNKHLDAPDGQAIPYSGNVYFRRSNFL